MCSRYWGYIAKGTSLERCIYIYYPKTELFPESDVFFGMRE